MNNEQSLRVLGYAQQFNLPGELVFAIIKTESAGNEFAYRVEPPYRYLVDANKGKPFRKLTATENKSEVAPKDFPYIRGLSSRHTEWWGQQASWGLMQVMGAVAREYGFKKAFPELCGYSFGVEFGCKHLSALRDRFLKKHGWEGVAAAYNAGSPRMAAGGGFENQHYVNKIRDHGGFDF